MKCLVHRPLPSKDEWNEAYTRDKDANYILSRLKYSKVWEESEIRKIHKECWQPLQQANTMYNHGRLVLVGVNAISNHYLT